jgi:TolB protein
VLLKGGGEFASHPAWSPDGKRLTYQTNSSDFGDDDQVWQSKLDGSDAKRVADGGRDPVWSPDGNRIAFIDDGATCSRIRSANPDGTAPRTLFEPTGGCDAAPRDVDISPDGRRLVFTGSRGGNKSDVFIMRLSSKPKQLTKGGFEGDPVFSPDGRTVAFDSSGIETIPAGGGKARVLLDKNRVEGNPAWQPLGR